MRTETVSGFKSAMLDSLKTIVLPGLRFRASKQLTLSVSTLESKQAEATVDLILSTKFEHVYLQAHIFGGRLHALIEQLQLPRERNNLMAKGVFFLTTLGEKKKEFSPDIGGARLLYDEMPMKEVVQEISSRIKSTYLPIVESVLQLSPALATYVIDRPVCFSYPLTILAVLQRLGISNAYAEALTVPNAKLAFKKEWGFDIQAALGSLLGTA
jgi:hypothetical protein